MFIYIFFSRLRNRRKLQCRHEFKKIENFLEFSEKKGGANLRQTNFERIQKFESVFKIFNIRIPRPLVPNMEKNLRKKNLSEWPRQSFLFHFFDIPIPLKCTINDPLYVRVIEITSFQQKNVSRTRRSAKMSRGISHSWVDTWQWISFSSKLEVALILLTRLDPPRRRPSLPPVIHLNSVTEQTWYSVNITVELSTVHPFNSVKIL